MTDSSSDEKEAIADMADMASSIQPAAATSPDGMVISLPDPDSLGPAIKAAVAAGEHDKARELMEQCKAKTLS